MRCDVGCGFVSRHKRVECFHVYLTLTIHLPLIQVSRVWSTLIPSMTSTGRQCWSTSDHLFAEPCAMCRTLGRAMEQQPPVCRVMACAACAMLSPLHPGPQTQCTPGCVTVGTGAAGQGGSLMSECLNNTLSSHPNTSVTAHEKVAFHLLSLSGVLLACNTVMLTKARF